MSFWSDLLSRAGNVGFGSWFTPRVMHFGAPGMDDLNGIIDPQNMTVAELWKSQPHLRTVISFRARNVAQLGVHSFRRVSDTDRQRDHTSPMARALRRPDTMMTLYDLIFALVGDLDLYDRAYWLVIDDPEDPSRPLFRRLPPPWIEPVFKDVFTIEKYRVYRGDQTVEIPAENVLTFTGYTPVNPIGASPTIETLKDTLREQLEAAAYRQQIWKRGGRVSSVLERPKDAPEWSDTARERFREDWYTKFTGKGSKAGGTPILEDGMTLRRIDFSAQEQQFVDVAKLSLSTVASSYHINPTMVGLLDNANYSNVREFRRMLYGDSLGPTLAQIEARINAFLLPMIGMDPDEFYIEFNISEKLKGSFEEQAAVMQTMVGAPIMTRNEGRSKFNLSAIEGGDVLVTPLNVLVGGQASPTDSGTQNRRSRNIPKLKERAPSTHEERFAGLLKEFFERQGSAVSSRIGARRSDWWDGDRWDGELSDELMRMYQLSSETAARSALEAVGLEDYDVDQTLNYLRVAADNNASKINAATRDQVTAAIDEDEPVSHVFDVAASSRSAEIAATTVTFASAFGTLEAARQNSDNPTKTWRVTSEDPREEHAALDGETVPLDEPFSNGMMYPGSFGSADQTAGCQCDVQINFNPDGGA